MARSSSGAPTPAGRVAPWLREVQAAIRSGGEMDVPCGSCTACCTASQFVHIEPDEAETLARIPAALLFPAPRLSRGNVVMGYDERGHCPMLVGGRCSIYEHRPRACRTYDCRVFAAAGLEPDGPAQAGVAERVRRWRLDVVTDEDRDLLDAVRTAVVEVRRGPDPPATALGVAVAAITSLATRPGQVPAQRSGRSPDRDGATRP